jgi:alpha-beta hydrolase superfamily lysophospholipase
MDFALRKPFPRRLAIALAMVVVLTACGTAAFQHEESRLTFRVVRETPGWYTGMPDGVQEFDLPVAASGEPFEHFHVWWWRAPGGRPDAPAIRYLHGARWSLTGQLFRIEELRDFGFSVLAIDYRGFGKSDGDTPTEKSVYEDAHVAWKWLAARQPDPKRRYIYGHSLGGAVAVDLAASLSAAGAATETPAAAGLIIESSFTTLEDMAKSLTYPWLPVGLLLSQKFDSMSKMAKVKLPVLIVHGGADRFVPVRFSEALYQAATGPKKLLLIDGATHNNSMRTGALQYRHALAEIFGLGVAAPPRTSAPRRLGLTQ